MSEPVLESVNLATPSLNLALPDGFEEKAQTEFIGFFELISWSWKFLRQNFIRAFFLPWLWQTLLIVGYLAGIILFTVIGYTSTVDLSNVNSNNQEAIDSLVNQVARWSLALAYLIGGLLLVIIFALRFRIRAYKVLSVKNESFFSRMFLVNSLFWPFVGLSVLTGLAYSALEGIPFGIIGSIVLSIFVQFSLYLLLFEKNGILTAIAKSAILVKPHFWKVFLRGLWLSLGVFLVAMFTVVPAVFIFFFSVFNSFSSNLEGNSTRYLSGFPIALFLFILLLAILFGLIGFLTTSFQYLGFANLRLLPKANSEQEFNSFVWKVNPVVIMLVIVALIVVSLVGGESTRNRLNNDYRSDYQQYLD